MRLPSPPSAPSPSIAPPARPTLEWYDDLDAIGAEWRALPPESVFTTWEWASAWWRHFGAGRALLVARVADGSGRVGIVPLTVGRVGPLRVVRFVGHGVADQLGVVGGGPDPSERAAFLRAALEHLPTRADVFVGERLTGLHRWEEERGMRLLRREASPVLDLEGLDWEGYLQTLGKKLRYQIRADERKLREEHEVRFRRTESLDRLEDDFATFLGLHSRRWQRDESSLLAQQDFHRDFSAQALERGWLELAFLEVDGEAVAARYDFRVGRTHFAYNAGRDPSWQRVSVGLVLRAWTMRRAIAEGATRYAFLRGDEDYKYRFGPDDHGVVTVARGLDGRGRMAIGGVALLARRPATRALLGRIAAD